MDFIFLIGWIMLGYWCYTIAEKNGRDKIWAFLFGITLGIFAVIGYYIAGATAEVKLERAYKLTEKKKKESGFSGI